MVEVGESTGALQEMLNSLADFYDEEIDTNLGRFITLVEPVLLVIMGIVIAGLLLSLYMPLFNCRRAEQSERMNGIRSAGRHATRTEPDPSSTSAFRKPVAAERAAETAQARRLAERYRLPFVDLSQFSIDHDLFRTIPADLMLRYGFVPYRREGNALVIVVSDPTDLPMIDELAVLLATPIKVTVGDAVGDPGDPEEERELAARPRGRDRELPAADPARGRAATNSSPSTS